MRRYHLLSRVRNKRVSYVVAMFYNFSTYVVWFFPSSCASTSYRERCRDLRQDSTRDASMVPSLCHPRHGKSNISNLLTLTNCSPNRALPTTYPLDPMDLRTTLSLLDQNWTSMKCFTPSHPRRHAQILLLRQSFLLSR